MAVRVRGSGQEVVDAGPAAPPARGPGPGEAHAPRQDVLANPLAVAALLATLMAACLWLRAGGLGAPLWMDEAISIGLASHPLGDIPGLLRLDGAPPLYYLLLHAWMKLFGRTETATHALSLVFSVAAVPVALWAGWSLFGRRAGWILAALVACNPFLSYFATETRMYALVALLALVATASFVHAFVFARRKYLWLLAPSLALVLYTHYWGLWLLLGAVVALVPCAAASDDRRRLARDAAVTFGAVALAYLPWVPTLAYQQAHTGAPWSGPPLVREMITVVAVVLGDPHERVLVALLLVAGPVLWSLARSRDTTSVALAAMASLAVVPVVAGWLAAQASPSWAPRYLAVSAPAILLLASVGLAAARAPGVLALGLILAVWVQPFARLSGARPAGGFPEKGSVKALSESLSPGLEPGDLVIAMQMEEVPVLAYYLPPGLRFATATGPVGDPTIADWRDALGRTQAATVATSLAPLLEPLDPGTDVLLVCAEHGRGPESLSWFALMKERCGQWRAALEADPRFVAVPAWRLPSTSEEVPREVLRFTRTKA
ncbi:MAG: glycosyltransferase family 39 protein [Actinomycetota bacterium]|nr:glycosyltransferase family 39 protein [Actinomycetota bacterium]